MVFGEEEILYKQTNIFWVFPKEFFHDGIWHKFCIRIIGEENFITLNCLYKNCYAISWPIFPIQHPFSQGNTKSSKISIVYAQGLFQVWEQIAYLGQSISLFKSSTGILIKIELLGLAMLAFEL